MVKQRRNVPTERQPVYRYLHREISRRNIRFASIWRSSCGFSVFDLLSPLWRFCSSFRAFSRGYSGKRQDSYHNILSKIPVAFHWSPSLIHIQLFGGIFGFIGHSVSVYFNLATVMLPVFAFFELQNGNIALCRLLSLEFRLIDWR